MMDTLATWLQLAPGEALVMIAGVLVASVVRGFAGFALTAIVMAGVSLVLPPVELLSVCLILEAVASLFMLRSGFQEADLKLVLTLLAGSLTGVPIGLSLTTSVPPDVSRMLTQGLILALALSQLLKIQPGWLASQPGRLIAGLISGIATGVAGIGGMVVAMFVLVQDLPPRVARGSLVVFLFIGLAVSGSFQYLFGVMTAQAVSRGLILAPLTVVGVLIGQQLFRPGRERLYRRVCLFLLIGFAGLGLIKAMV